MYCVLNVSMKFYFIFTRFRFLDGIFSRVFRCFDFPPIFLRFCVKKMHKNTRSFPSYRGTSLPLEKTCFLVFPSLRCMNLLLRGAPPCLLKMRGNVFSLFFPSSRAWFASSRGTDLLRKPRLSKVKKHVFLSSKGKVLLSRKARKTKKMCLF